MTAEKITVSIVIFNSSRWLEDFFYSLSKQDFPAKNLHVVIKDNGSTDGSWEWIQTNLDRLASLFCSITCETGRNIGFGCGHNSNLQKASTKFFLVTNVDLLFQEDTLQKLLDVAQRSDERVAQWECRQKPYEHPKHYHPASMETAWCSSACTLFRVDALHAVGGYEERLFLYGEDVELSFRLRDNGWKLLYVPQASVWHYTYEHANQVKPAQFLGSTLANALIRCRYGNWSQVVQGFFMMVLLLFVHENFTGQRRAVAGNIARFLLKAPAFLLTRKKSSEFFPIRAWDYEFIRNGVFYEYPKFEQTVTPLVSVLVRTTPGCGARLKEAIQSVLNQTYPRIELVVVEDGDNSAEGYVQYIDSLGQLESVVYRSLPKVGRCIAGNRALHASQGELLCFLDDDDLLYADHLEVLVHELSKFPELGGVYGLAFQVDTHVVSKERWEYKEILHSVVHNQPFNRGVLWHHNFLPIQCVLFKRILFETYGGFDEELENLEDWNLWVRYTQQLDLRLVDKVTSIYRVPHEKDMQASRQEKLDMYYKIALSKNDAISVQMTPSQIVAMVNEIAARQDGIHLPTARLNRLIERIPGARLAMKIPGARFVMRPVLGYLRKFLNS